jgi:glycosyltransferase involved in cell wall biosynthesis
MVTTRGPASKSVLLLDISRLIWRARRRGPTGIDRVELAYARHFLTEQGERSACGALHLLGFVFAISPAGARGFVVALAARWEGGAPAGRWSNFLALLRLYSRLIASRWSFGPWLRWELRKSPEPAIFLVVSHHHVAREYTIARIRSNLGVQCVCLIHDLIPIEYPEYFKRGWEARYRRLSANVGSQFDAVIANSDATARALHVCLRRDGKVGAAAVAIRVAPLGVRAFQRSRSALLARQNRPYFVVLGTIEPRKNHLLLLNLWTRLAAAVAAPPRLLVIGARGWENEQVVDMLERSRRLRGLVEEHNRLSDADVGALLHGARALLLPSLAEGFGLPLAEALASGVPVICSDIPVFREVGREAPEYLDPLDLSAWSEAVLDYRQPDSPTRAAQLRRLARWLAPRWSDHFHTVEQMLRDLEANRHRPAAAQNIAPQPGLLGPS